MTQGALFFIIIHNEYYLLLMLYYRYVIIVEDNHDNPFKAPAIFPDFGDFYVLFYYIFFSNICMLW